MCQARDYPDSNKYSDGLRIYNQRSYCRISSFADDTRKSGKISQLSDSYLLQEDLNRIIGWSEDNNMKLQEDKFKLQSYRTPAARKLSDTAFRYQTTNRITLVKSALVKDLEITV